MRLKLLDLIKFLPGDDTPDFDTVMPFVFSPTGLPKRGPGSLADPISNYPYEGVLACPFPRFSIELDGDKGLMGHPEAQQVVQCVYCHELTPDTYRFIIFGYIKGRPVAMWVDKGDDNYPSIARVVELYLRRIHDNTLATFEPMGHQKYRHRGNKRDHRVARAIYVTSKDQRADGNTPTTTAGGCRLTHVKGWIVRAHWRRLKNPESFGLDRYGDRTVRGFTWVSAYGKGDDVETIKPRYVG